MANYDRTSWQNGSNTPINASNLNKIENGIYNNSNAIDNLVGSMHFRGTFDTNTQPANPSIGDVYQATDSGMVGDKSYKIGDLIVYTTASWHVIPSGDETSGTVTSITAGDGITIGGGPITTSGTIQINPGYTANSERNGLMTSEQADKLNRLATVALTGDYNDLIGKPIALTPSPDIPLDPEQASEALTVSQKALSGKFNSKADTNHQHTINEVSGLASKLKPDDGPNTEMVEHVASATHSHGNISADGKLTGGYSSSTTFYLSTNAVNNTIIGTQNIPSTAISGTQLAGRNLESYYNKVDDMFQHFPKEGSGQSSSTALVNAADAEHTHDLFSTTSPGFVPEVPTGTRQYSLRSDGWYPLPENFIDLVYPSGSYYETSLRPYPPNKSNVSDVTDEEKAALGSTWFNPNIAWGGTWKRETPGYVHVSGSFSSPTKYIVNGQLESKSVGADAQTPMSSKTVLIGNKDGGVETVTLTASQSGLRNHTHSIKPIKFYVRRSSDAKPTVMTGGAGKTGVTIKSIDDTYSAKTKASDKEKDKVVTWAKTTTTKEFPSSISINLQAKKNPTVLTGKSRNAVDAHENMQPFINVYRWHRIDGQPAPIYRATAIVTANSYTKVYGDNDPSNFTAIISGSSTLTQEMKDAIQYSFARELDPDTGDIGENVGEWDIVVRADSPQTLVGTDFDIETVAGILTITRKTIYLKADDVTQSQAEGDDFSYSIYSDSNFTTLYTGRLTDEDIDDLNGIVNLEVNEATPTQVDISIEDDDMDGARNFHIGGLDHGRVTNG